MPSLSKLKIASQVFKELSMDAALHDVKNGQSLKGAARLHGVSRTTQTGHRAKNQLESELQLSFLPEKKSVLLTFYYPIAIKASL
ncbi:hypothetical protein RvY_15632 [Ramazzottius varieornatus]|uniref:HTH psq-type domain-containing protein n=1 Tax=Ramazzottius varieornatus TaxID=947166 RepID=A0A1D1VWS5_RAMVA|nr:hypothetical protein RvY_15632 [Ramazzottius varieornatus]